MRVVSAFREVHFVLVTLVIYALVTGRGVMLEGNNLDDWRHLSGAVNAWSEIEGRWLMDLIFQYLLRGSFHLPLQLALAYLCFLAISWIIATLCSPKDQRAFVATFVFLIGVNFPYMADSMNFGAHVFAYPFAMLLSLGAFFLLHTAQNRVGVISYGLICILAAQLLAFSLAIYQPFAVFGAIVPLIVLTRWDIHKFGTTVWLFLICAGVSVVAILLYPLEWSLVMDAKGQQISSTRFSAPNAEILQRKLDRFPSVMNRVLGGYQMLVPPSFRAAIRAFALAALLLPLFATVVSIGSKGRSFPAAGLNLLRVFLAVPIGLGLVPILFWFTTTDFTVPARALAYLGFWECAFLAAGLSLLLSFSMPGWVGKTAQAGVTVALVGFAAFNLYISNQIWTDHARQTQQEAVLAEAIMNQVRATPGYADQRLRLSGTYQNTGRDWGGSLGRTIFSEDNDLHGIFKVTYEVPWRAESVPISPRNCPAFPQDGSVYLDGDYAYACLEEFEAFQPPEDCVQSSDPKIGRICSADGALTRILLSCPETPANDGFPYVRGLDADGNEIASLWLNRSYLVFELDGVCIQMTHSWPAGVTDLIVATKDRQNTIFNEELLKLP